METKNHEREAAMIKESKSTATTTPKENAKAKFTLKKLISPAKAQKVKLVILGWLKKLPRRLVREIIIGFVIGLVLNVIDNYFLPDLDTMIPTVFGFFNGFVTFVEFLFKVAFGFIGSLFSGNFLEFNKSVWAEFVEMLGAFWNWISSFSF